MGGSQEKEQPGPSPPNNAYFYDETGVLRTMPAQADLPATKASLPERHYPPKTSSKPDPTLSPRMAPVHPPSDFYANQPSVPVPVQSFSSNKSQTPLTARPDVQSQKLTSATPNPKPQVAPISSYPGAGNKPYQSIYDSDIPYSSPKTVVSSKLATNVSAAYISPPEPASKSASRPSAPSQSLPSSSVYTPTPSYPQARSNVDTVSSACTLTIKKKTASTNSRSTLAFQADGSGVHLEQSPLPQHHSSRHQDVP